MKDQSKTKQVLIQEMSLLRQKIAELEQSEPEHMQAEEFLQQERELYLDLVNNQPVVIYRIRVFPIEQWRKDAWNSSKYSPYSLEFVSDRYCEILGINRQVIEMNPSIVNDLVHTEDKAEFTRKNEEANAQLIPFQWEGRLVIKGKILWVHFESLPRPVANGDVIWTGILYDINDRKRAEEALRKSEERYRKLSIVDDLTQLYNSRHFYFQLKIEIDRSNRYEQPLTLLLLDLDNFKAFNDTYGHVEGDKVLRRLGLVVKRCLRQTDSAYRYGGEEFTILLPMTTSEQGTVTAERIRAKFKKELFSPAPGQGVYVTVSIGLAQYRTQEDMKVFVHRVDQLMYQGKKNGKDTVCSES
jgi:diguanylate cyclase (GGDEF)-like protein/PAS domain S-box-containing protein